MKNKIIIYIVWGIMAILAIWLLSSLNNKQGTKNLQIPKSASKTEYIREEFNNSKVIEAPLDEKITRDNWECTDDCSGHNAGYEWAEEKGITDPSDCGGNSQSFIEGCEAYANEHNEDYDY